MTSAPRPALASRCGNGNGDRARCRARRPAGRARSAPARSRRWARPRPASCPRLAAPRLAARADAADGEPVLADVVRGRCSRNRPAVLLRAAPTTTWKMLRRSWRSPIACVMRDSSARRCSCSPSRRFVRQALGDVAVVGDDGAAPTDRRAGWWRRLRARSSGRPCGGGARSPGWACRGSRAACDSASAMTRQVVRMRALGAEAAEQFLGLVAFDVARPPGSRYRICAVRVDQRDAVRAVFDERAEAALALAQRFVAPRRARACVRRRAPRAAPWLRAAPARRAPRR